MTGHTYERPCVLVVGAELGAEECLLNTSSQITDLELVEDTWT